MMKESRESSISSFSSEDSEYKEKFEKEREKYLKLKEKLRGYQSVANQCKKEQVEKQLLLQEVERLKGKDQIRSQRQHITECNLPCGENSQVLTELQDPSFQTRRRQPGESSSSSFEVVHQVYGGHPIITSGKVTGTSALSLSQNQGSQPEDIQQHLKNQTQTVLTYTSNHPGHDKNIRDPLTERAAKTESETPTSHAQNPAHINQKQCRPPANNNMSTFPSIHFEAELTASQDTLSHGQNTGPFIPQERAVVSQPRGVPVSSTANTWGVGARPKDKNTLDRLPINTIHSQSVSNSGPPLVSNEDRRGETMETAEATTSSETPELSPNAINITLGDVNALNLNSNSDILALNIPSTAGSQEVLHGGDTDLMMFPILETPPSPENRKSVNDPFVKQQNPVVSSPSDEQESQLASQAHSLVVKLQSGGAPMAGMSDSLYQFAEAAAQMERKFVEYQSLIQRQQVQIQSYSQKSKSEELQQLRLENKNLMDLLKNQLGVTSSKVTENTKISSEKQQAAVHPLGSTSEMAKKIEELKNTNEQLYKANKDWHTRWQSLQHNGQEEKGKLEKQISSLTGQVDNLRGELTALEKHVQETNDTKMKAIKKNFDLDQEKLNLSRQFEILKAQHDELLRLKRKQEMEISSLKTQGPREPCHAPSGSVHQSGEVDLLKQQLAVFHEDFQKEREDRSKAEGKMEKMRKERDSARSELAAKMKKMQTMLNAKDVDLNRRSKQVNELQQYTLALKKELQRQRSKTADSTRPQQPTSPGQHMLYPSGGTRSALVTHAPKDEGFRCHTFPGTGPGQHQLSPEHLPNAWQCQECTFINFPERTICDICGWRHTVGGELQNGGFESHSAGIPELKSRGEIGYEPPTDEPDVVTDSESGME